MTALVPGLAINGDFLLLPSGEAALNIAHIVVIHVTGREDPDHPQAKNVQLNAEVDSDPDLTYVLGRFKTFVEAHKALGELLTHIFAQSGRVTA